MPLSSDIISQFVKATKVEKEPTEQTVYGTIVKYEGKDYVKLDGSDLLTPISKTTSVTDGDRVSVLIKNHTAIVDGNISDPSASGTKVTEMGNQITEFDIIVSHKVVAEEIEAVNGYFETIKAITAKYENAYITNAEIDKLYAKYAEVEYLSAKDIEAINIEVERIQGMFAEFKDITAEDLEAVNAEFTNLTAYNANFTYVSTEVLEAIKANIKTLDVEKLSAEQADLKYANIDFANIGEAAIEKLFSDSGIIKDLIVSEGKITGELVGVTIKGDLIEGNTVKADKLVVKGEDGIYYKLNFEGGTFKDGEAVPDDGIHGSVIVAKSITAEQIAVNDLVAFGATIGGFKIESKSIYSGVKESVDNTTRGIYMDTDGQMAFGDSNNFVKFFKDANGNYKLEIAAETFKLGPGGKTVEELIEENATDLSGLEIGGRNLLFNSKGDNVTNWIHPGMVVSDSIKGYCIEKSTTSTGEHYVGTPRTNRVEPSTKYTFSCDIWVNEYVKSVELFWLSDTEEYPQTGSQYVNITNKLSFNPTPNAWTKVVWTFETKADDYTGYIRIDNNGSTVEGSIAELRVANLKLEKGTKATDWTAAPEDIDDQTSDQLEDLRGSINDTIENTKNDILTDVKDQYVTKSDIQTSIEDLTLTMEKDRETMSFNFEGIQKTVETLNNETFTTFAEWEKYIRFEQGNIILGQLGNQLTLRITNEKISFLQAGNEVAYFSNQKLYITDAEILHSLIIGNFAYIPRANGSLDFKKVR